ncbi:MAG: serine/threonine protein kinase, partial [Deltaproteobacteria bacterium HGW-Deltaproteobacteria-20]
MLEEDEATRVANPGPGARYELLAPIASGGMATVYVGRQFGAGGFQRIVAIKRMHPHIAESPELTAMFRDEARIASLIHHTNVVAIIDVFEASGEQLLVMDFVDGVSLGQLRKELRGRGVPFPPAIALRIVVEALRGLHAAHEQKDMDGVPLQVVHRDATPHNILLGVDGSVKVTDFGIARAAERSAVTSAGQAKGKFAYMAPEQCAGGTMDRRVDVFAMGIVLWELLVGRPLFHGDNDAVIISQITSGNYTRPLEARPSIPKRLDGVVMGALRANPDERYATALAYADAIEAFAPEIGGLAPAEEIGKLVMAACGERVNKRRHHVHEVIGGRRPNVPWGAAPPSHASHGGGTGSQGYVAFPSGSVSTHHGPLVEVLDTPIDFRSRPSPVRLAVWIGGGLT